MTAKEKHYAIACEELLRGFNYGHLPENLQHISQPFGLLASQLYAFLPYNFQKLDALNQLMKAKDSAVRAFLAEDAHDDDE